MSHFYNKNLYLHLFALFPAFGPTRLMRLVKAFPDYEKAYSLEVQELINSGIAEANIIESWIAFKQSLNIEFELEKLIRNQIGLTAFNDADYPELLRQISQPPVLLYYRGNLPNANSICLAVVGTRTMTSYGQLACKHIVTTLAKSGLIIVSGLAYGIDAISHKIALDNKTKTIAIVASGVDEASLYPKEHALLAEEIINSGGAIISEYPIGRPALKQNFVARNRIIAGLCIGTLVVECSVKSGARITATHTLDQNRNLYVVPGPIFSKESEGPNELLKLGAKPVTKSEDILEDLNIKVKTEINQINIELTTQEQKIVSSLGFEPVGLDELIRTSGLPASEVNATLTFLEIKGVIKNLGNNQYVSLYN